MKSLIRDSYQTRFNRMDFRPPPTGPESEGFSTGTCRNFTRKEHDMKRNQVRTWLCLVTALLLALPVILPGSADASTAQGTVIENRVTVNYKDAGGTDQAPVTVAAKVTITLVQGTPNVAVSSVSSATINQGQTTTITYNVTATSNGPETYTFGSGSANVSNMNPAGSGAAPVPASATLGATTLAVNAPIGATTIKVPYDQVAAATSVNGIAPGDIIVIAGNPYTVAVGGIDKTNATVWGDPNYNMVTITLTSAIAGSAGSAGTVVGARSTFTATFSSGTVDTGFTSGTFNVNGTAKSPTGTIGTSFNTLITTNKPSLTVQKLVAVDGTGTVFAATGNAAPGTSLVYKIVITNSGTADATSVRITDSLPSYLTYVAAQSRYATSAATTYAAATALTEGAGGFSFVGNTVNYNPGGVLGTVTPGNVLVLFYRCTIN